jgi:hypothetical protein
VTPRTNPVGVILTDRMSSPAAPLTRMDAYAIVTDTMDAWLEAILNDRTTIDYASKVVKNKPASATDSCWDDKGARITAPIRADNSGPCGALFPAFGNARIAAGAPISEDRVKCTLKPADYHQYKVSFSSDQRVRLKRIFASGVCDYSVKGQSQEALAGTWLSWGPAYPLVADRDKVPAP